MMSYPALNRSCRTHLIQSEKRCRWGFIWLLLWTGPTPTHSEVSSCWNFLEGFTFPQLDDSCSEIICMDDNDNVTSCGRRALPRQRLEDDEATQLGREWNRTFIECKARGYIGVIDSRIRHIRRLPDHAVAQYRNDPKPRGSARHESARITKHNN